MIAIAPLPARRVRVLRLIAPDDTSVRRGAILLEDALHTASLPDGDGGRLIVVRSLNLGRINSAWSAGTVALALEQRWRELAAGAVYAENPTATGQSAVYFRDRAEAVTLLALRLARGFDVGAWFWPLAVPGWQPGPTGISAQRRVLAAALALPVPLPALLGLLEALHDAGALGALFDALRPADGPALLAVCGWERSEIVPGTARTAGPSAIASGWRDELAQAVAGWGPDDARSIWLAAAILAIAAPGRLGDARLADHAAHLARAVSLPQEQEAARATPGGQGEGERGRGGEGERRGASPADASVPQQPGSVQGPVAEPRAPGFVGPAEASGAFAPTGAVSVTRPTDDASPAHPAPSSAPDASQRVAGTEQSTRFAGLYLMLPMLARLGIAAMIESNPHLAELDLPGWILRDTARRLRISGKDPGLLTLRPTSRWTDECPFVAPVAWQGTGEQPGLATPGPRVLRPIAGRPATHVLCDASGRLPLALWHNRPSEAVSGQLGDGASGLDESNLQAAPALPRRSDAAVLLDAWAIAMRRWLAAYAGIRLGQLVRRPGIVAATRTHVDVFFPHRGADIRIRRAGLDLDPGWLPWFGRIVQYHYGDGMPF